MRHFLSRGAYAAIALLAGLPPAFGASAEYGSAHVATATGPVTLEMGGVAYVDQGLLGVGRVPASSLDFMGTTLGSFSGMAIDPASWRKDGDAYVATLYSLPDRGYNTADRYSDYPGRLVQFDLRFTPYAGADLPAEVASQSQIVLTPTGKGVTLVDFAGTATTGFDPDAGITVQDGHSLPSPEGEGPRQVALDAEAVAFTADGGFYVGDEYTAGIYLFDADGKMAGFIPPVPALAPMTGGKLNYNSKKAPDTGRRNNQGMEAAALTPDGKTLIAVLQSATMQDSAGKGGERGNTRVLVYDVSSDPTPQAPVGHYVLQLPLVDTKGDGKMDKTAAQSEVVALNDHQFLVLARDSAGYGTEKATPIMYKSILLADTTGATNLAGTEYETGTKPISEGRKLDPAITPVATGELINLLNSAQLARFGMNLDTAAPKGGTTLTLSEKWEAMSLMPALDPAHPDDYILFVANDNDFLATKGVMPGYTYDAGLDNDTTILAFRVTIPGVQKP
ncbi:esterase-like activity of phytase family protein [Zavarzinia compransoris]|uniref:esterase-like activity of phytase family protein n=1 Tax=Zavarzinia marina TaxID=2911065 RepID=UPI001F20E3CA|nr:esterase-like activity of phytase family protein [Zavarzinia marina]MCF4165924.1 esterase-like activity of phytase family protein [Zavarzinia marina]